MHLMLAAKLAWKNSTNNPKRLAIRCAGITFAVVLMFMQNGFRDALFDSNVRIVEKIDCDIVIKNRSRYTLSSTQKLNRDALVLASGHQSVIESQPLYIEIAASYLRKIPDSSPNQPEASQGSFFENAIKGFRSRKVRVIGFDVASPMFTPFGIADQTIALETAGTAVADSKSSARTFQFDQKTVAELGDRYGELANKKIKLIGTFQLGIDFSNHGNLIMSSDSFHNYFAYRGRGAKDGDPKNSLDFGLLRCAPGTDVEQTVREIQTLVGEHYKVDSKDGFIKSERNFWSKNTPIGLVFLVGIIIGFVVGLIICYQVLATDIGDHLGEFATLKAMGYAPSFFIGVVVFQAVCLALFAFIPGLLITWVTFQVVNATSGLVMFLNFWRAGIVLALTVIMCVVSAFIALRKLLTADPASLF